MKAFSQSSRLKRQSALAVILLALGIASPAREETLSQDYEVTVNGRPIPVYACRVSAVPFNQVWPGYQRPLDQTESAGFASWDMKRPVKEVVDLALRGLGRHLQAAGRRPYDYQPFSLSKEIHSNE